MNIEEIYKETLEFIKRNDRTNNIGIYDQKEENVYNLKVVSFQRLMHKLQLPHYKAIRWLYSNGYVLPTYNDHQVIKSYSTQKKINNKNIRVYKIYTDKLNTNNIEVNNIERKEVNNMENKVKIKILNKPLEGRIFETKDLSKFNKLEGNREVLAIRVEKIKKSMKDVGYIPSPIICNEKLEVVDGQGRLEAIKELNLSIPIYYIVIPGIGLDECIAMNIVQGKWTNFDFICTYAGRGIRDYKLLKDLIEKFPDYQQNFIASAARKGSKLSAKTVREGNFELSDEDYEDAKITLSSLSETAKKIRKTKGIKDYGGSGNLIQAMIFCYNYVDDKEKYKSQILKNFNKVGSWGSLGEAVEKIESMYNFGLSRENKILFAYKYKEEKLK